MKGTKALVTMLERKGVDTVFGYPGGSVIPIYDELYDADLRHILVRHEQCAAHMADGYARASGKPGVCLATSGPGATNLVTGVATAFADSVPMIAFTGQVGTGSLGLGAFQEVDAYSVMMPITKHNFRVLDVSRLPHAITEAWEICQTGRPGPVHIDLPVDQMNSDVDESLLDEEYGIKPVCEELSGFDEAVQGSGPPTARSSSSVGARSTPARRSWSSRSSCRPPWTPPSWGWAWSRPPTTSAWVPSGCTAGCPPSTP